MPLRTFIQIQSITTDPCSALVNYSLLLTRKGGSRVWAREVCVLGCGHFALLYSMGFTEISNERCLSYQCPPAHYDTSVFSNKSKQCWALALCSATFDAENFREFTISISFNKDLLSIQYIILIAAYLAQSVCLTSNTVTSQFLKTEINLILLTFRYPFLTLGANLRCSCCRELCSTALIANLLQRSAC